MVLDCEAIIYAPSLYSSGVSAMGNGTNLMITTLASLRRNAARMIRRINKNSKQIFPIRVKNISDIKGVSPEHPFRKDLFVTI